MFCLSELVEFTRTSKQKFRTQNKTHFIRLTQTLIFLFKHSYMFRSNDEYHRTTNTKFQSAVKYNANIFTLLDPLYQ
jgi:hypothetical protein